MKIPKTSIDQVKKNRADYLRSLPEFQELLLTLMICHSDYFIFQADINAIVYAIRNNDGVLIEFYILDKYIPGSNEIFRKVLNDLSITDIYGKSFDPILLSNCLLKTLPYLILELMHRYYFEPERILD